jgi:GTP cyclohydrolase I
MDKVEKGVQLILDGLQDEYGLKLDENFLDTPSRVSKAYSEIFSGLKNTQFQISKVLSSKFPAVGYDEMISLNNHISYSMCPHHLLPVEYISFISYLPSDKGFVLGASKLGRVVDILAARPVLQETLTQDIAKALESILPKGVAVFLKGIHYCMRMRGLKTPCASMITTFTSGAYRKDSMARSEFFSIVNMNMKGV